MTKINFVLYTNGYINNKEIEEAIFLSNIKAIHISIDGFNANTHDDFRGVNNSLEVTRNFMSKCIGNNIEVVVNTVATNNNVKEIPMLHAKIKGMKLKHRIDFLSPEGRANENLDLHLSSKEYSSLIINLKENINCQKNFYHPFCGVGHNLLYVDAFGDVYLCSGLKNYHSFGNLNKSNMKNIIEHIKTTSSYMIKCRNASCTFYNACGSGCRARAFNLCSDIQACDTIMFDIYNNLERRN